MKRKKKKKRMERITSRDSVSVCAKNEPNSSSYAKPIPIFNLNWHQRIEYYVRVVVIHAFVVYCTYAWHITNGEMIFCLSASHTCQQSVFIRRSLFRNASVCYSLWRLIEWFVNVLVGQLVWRMIDSRTKRSLLRYYVKWYGKWAAT